MIFQSVVRSWVIATAITLCAPFTTRGQEVELNEKGLHLMGKGKYQEALPIFNKLVGLDSLSTIYRYNRAVTFTHLNLFQNAIRDYLILVKQLPDEAEYHFQLGDLFERAGNQTNAEVYYGNAIRLEKENFHYFFKRGTFFLKRNSYALAIKDFDESINLNPEHHSSYHNRGIARYKVGLKELACEDWCQALLKGSPNSASHLDRNCERYPKPCLLTEKK
ncbi:MAG: tetratricopeptide repeat protein [Bacteroidetes bacterium]|nr:tetratricopeptide repeat protein [Bacteroidota bacterium]